MLTVAAFHGEDYDGQYISFAAGEALLQREPPAGVDTEGWSYGYLLGAGVSGWYPPECARTEHLNEAT